MEKNPNPKIFLIDGNSLAYRAFYALPDNMQTSSGIVTNAVYGFTTMLLKILEEEPDFVSISFDRPEPTFRHKEYQEYKATRQKAPPTLHDQMPLVKEIAEAFDVPIYEIAGFEADDVIGTLAKEAEKEGHEVVILTGDLDPLQLVNEKIKVMTTRKGITDTVLYGEKEVGERYGLRPDQIIDFKALKGDASDNIPGVPQVGEKTAIELLKEFDNLENILTKADQITKKALKENIKNNVHLAELSKKLATIITNVPIEIDFDKCKRGEINWTKALAIFEKFEFESLIKKYGKKLKDYSTEEIIQQKRDEIAEKYDFKCVPTEEELQNLINQLQSSPVFAFDLETTSLDPFAAKMVGISFSTETKSAYYVPNPDIEKLAPIFLSNQLKIGHNLKYDIAILKNHGVKVKGPLFDTMVAAYIIDPTSGKYALKKLGKQFLDRKMIKLVELIGKDAEYDNFAQVPLDIATDYACSDAEVTFALYEIFKNELKEQKLEKVFYEIEMPLVEVLVDMESNGVSIDVDLLNELSKIIDREINDLARHIFAIAGEVFNLNSPKQLSQILFNKLMLPIIKRTKTGPSTDYEVLEELAGKRFEIAEKLIDYRQLTKLKTTYVDVLPTLVNPKTNRLHTSFNQTITATGRLSSSDPNLQNIPARLHPAFIPGKRGDVIIDADYSQVELRVLAHLSEDSQLIKAFKEGKDVHKATAAEIFNVSEDKATKEQRDIAKTVNFGIIYGISDFGLAKSLKIKKSEAAKFIEDYFKKHEGVKEFIDKTIAQARADGFVSTLLGRKRPLPDINNPNAGKRSFAERTAINTPIQGTAADLIKIAMINVNSQLRTHNLKTKMIIQVHDELVFECSQEEIEIAKKLIKEEMENALSLIVPLKVDVGAGRNWGEAKT